VILQPQLNSHRSSFHFQISSEEKTSALTSSSLSLESLALRVDVEIIPLEAFDLAVSCPHLFSLDLSTFWRVRDGALTENIQLEFPSDAPPPPPSNLADLRLNLEKVDLD